VAKMHNTILITGLTGTKIGNVIYYVMLLIRSENCFYIVTNDVILFEYFEDRQLWAARQTT